MWAVPLRLVTNMAEPVARPHRGEIWLVALGAARQGELGKTRPAIVVSVDDLQTGSAFDRITVVPVTTSPRQRSNLLQPAIPAGCGLTQDSVILCNAPRAIVPSRFVRRLGQLPVELMDAVMKARALIEGWDE
jgi:mRNA interferase MazF